MTAEIDGRAQLSGWELELRQRAARAERGRDMMQAKYDHLGRLLNERTLQLAEARTELGKLKGEPTARAKEPTTRAKVR